MVNWLSRGISGGVWAETSVDMEWKCPPGYGRPR